MGVQNDCCSNGRIGPQKSVEVSFLIGSDSGTLSGSKLDFLNFFRSFHSSILGKSKLEIELWFIGQSSLEWPEEFEYQLTHANTHSYYSLISFGFNTISNMLRVCFFSRSIRFGM